MSSTREQTIASAIQNAVKGYIARTYRLMAKALIWAENLQGGNAQLWVPSRQFVQRNIPKPVLDKLVDELYLDKYTPPPFYWSAKDGNIFNPVQSDVVLDREFSLLIDHARSDRRIKKIIADKMGIDVATSFSEIEAIFRKQQRKERIRLYGAMLREIDRQGFRNPSYDYQEFTYRNRNSRYRLTTKGQLILRRNP